MDQPTYHLKILNVVKSEHSGHIAIHVRILERRGEETIQGATESYAIELTALQSRFQGEVEVWLRWVGREMKRNHLRRTALHTEVGGLQGKELEIED